MPQQISFSPEELEKIVLEQLPVLMEKSPLIQKLITDLAQHKKETGDRFYELLGELRRDREEQTRKWEEAKAEDKRKWEEAKAEDKRKWDEQARKWDEQARKWDEQARKWEEAKAEDKRQWDEQARKWEEAKAEDKRQWDESQRKWDADRAQERREREELSDRLDQRMSKLERTVGSVASRWGLQSEATFRNALAGILEESFGVEVLNVNDYDHEGSVFGRPDQVELDVIIKNGVLIVCELKSSIDKAGMYIFERKVRFYEKLHQRKVSRMLVISPMVDNRAKPVAEALGIEVYSDSVDVKTL